MQQFTLHMLGLIYDNDILAFQIFILLKPQWHVILKFDRRPYPDRHFKNVLSFTSQFETKCVWRNDLCYGDSICQSVMKYVLTLMSCSTEKDFLKIWTTKNNFCQVAVSGSKTWILWPGKYLHAPNRRGKRLDETAWTYRLM